MTAACSFLGKISPLLAASIYLEKGKNNQRTRFYIAFVLLFALTFSKTERITS